MQELPLPKLLKEIPDAPKKLYIEGVYPNEEKNIFLTVIGSRKYTSYGKTVCQKIINGLAGYPFVIVSGLAIGIDTIAHSAALEASLLTVSVLGSGLEKKSRYPSSNFSLSENIINNGGCLLSEYEPEFKATKWSFPRRNRIMAGISHAILVIEAENISGTRITAKLATEYNREVLSVPGSVFSTSSEGSNKLISEGAVLISKSQDIIEYFNVKKPEKVEKISANINTEERNLLEVLNETKSVETLCAQLNLPVNKISVIITQLELKGLVKQELSNITKL